MIDIRKLESLVRLMVENDLTELDLKDGEETVTVKRGGKPVVMAAPAAAPAVALAAAPAPATVAPAPSAPAAAPAAKPDEDAGCIAVESPMVGTFYATPGPDKPPFVQVGAQIGPESIVCLIEAMKIFNEIKAEKSGTIHKILVKSGQPVEFGQKLFLIKPS
jgi:acetyl-CoA carboxylase biotin carboxyl carrier protein